MNYCLSASGTRGYPTVMAMKVTFSESDSVVYTSFDGDSLASSESFDGNSGKCLSNNSNNVSLNIAQRRAADDPDNAFVSSILTIIPAEELEFCTSDENKDSIDVISLSNTTERHVAYKVKTTSPEKYRVRPSTGVIQPNLHADIHVYLHAASQSTGVSKDKFLIMFMEVEPEVTVSQVNDLFKITSRDNYSEHRLRCRLGTLTTIQEVHDVAGCNKSPISDQMEKLMQQMETLLSSHQRLESQMGQIRMATMVLVCVILLLMLTVFLTYWTEYLPVNKYTVNTCLPHPL